MIITKEQEAGMFRLLKDKSYAEVGFEFGLDKKYKKVSSMIGAVRRITMKVKNNPEEYGISLETVNEVADTVERRMTAGLNNHKEVPTLREQREIDNKDINGLIIGGRNKAAKLLNEKLDRLGKSRKALDEVDLGKLATVTAILVDKSQILQGQATEHIAVLSKNIDSNLTPEEAIELALKIREKNISEKVK